MGIVLLMLGVLLTKRIKKEVVTCKGKKGSYLITYRMSHDVNYNIH